MHTAAIRLRLSPAGEIEAGDDIVGVKAYARVAKSKVGPRRNTKDHTPGAIKFRFDGTDDYEVFIYVGQKLGMVERNGSWFEYDGIKGQGAVKFEAALREEGVWDDFKATVRKEFAKLVS
jgi:hypothetical protein